MSASGNSEALEANDVPRSSNRRECSKVRESAAYAQWLNAPLCSSPALALPEHHPITSGLVALADELDASGFECLAQHDQRCVLGCRLLALEVADGRT